MQSEDKIFIDDKWRPQDIEFFNKFNIKLPVLNEIYTFRNIEKTQLGIGVYLNEIHNEPSPVIHPMGRIEGYKEVSFSIKRFRNLDMSEITDEQIKEEKEELKNSGQFVKRLDKNNYLNN